MSFGDGNLHERVKQLEAENEKLRDSECDVCAASTLYFQVKERDELIAEQREKIEQLKAENAAIKDDAYDADRIAVYFGVQRVKLEIGIAERDELIRDAYRIIKECHLGCCPPYPSHLREIERKAESLGIEV